MANSIFDLVNLTGLPAPDVVDTLEYTDIFAQVLALFRTFAPAYTFLTEADPCAKLMEAWSYRELIMRARINDAAKGTLLAFATGGTLDHLGANQNVARLVVQAADLTANPPLPLIMEDDESFRYRIQARIPAYSSAGVAGAYRFFALSASPFVKDALVYSPDDDNGYNMGGQVNVVILSSEPGQNLIPTQGLLDTVKAALYQEGIKAVGDILVVEAAIPTLVPVTASVKLLPRAPMSVFNNLASVLANTFQGVQALGWDVTFSWLGSVLQQAGVHSVNITAPAADVIIAPNEFPQLGTIALTFDGYSDSEPLALAEMETKRTTRTVYETYVAYAVARKRTKDQIKADLAYAPSAGVIQPTIEGLAAYLGIENLQNSLGAFYDKDALAFLIWRKLSPRYAA